MVKHKLTFLEICAIFFMLSSEMGIAAPWKVARKRSCYPGSDPWNFEQIVYLLIHLSLWIFWATVTLVAVQPLLFSDVKMLVY